MATRTATATIAASPSASATPLPLDTYEPDDRQNQASRLIVGDVQYRSFFTPSGDDVDWVLLHLKPGRWRISAATTTGIYDPRIQMGQLAGDDEDGKNAIIEVAITVEADHYLLVENLGLDGPGQYTLTLERLGGLQTPTSTPTSTPGPGAEDGFEDDTPPNTPGYAGPQLRTFNPPGDVDYVRFRIKGDLRTWFETHDLTGAADTELLIFHDDDGVLTQTDPLLNTDDDGGEGLGSKLSLKTESDLWLTVVIRNRSAAWGPAVGYTLSIITAEQATPTPTNTPGPTAPPDIQPKPTYTPYPTNTAYPSPTPQPTYTPYPVPTLQPTYTPYPARESSSLPRETTSPPRDVPQGGAAVPVSVPVVPTAVPTLAPTPTVAPALLRLTVYTDINRDNVMNWNEEAEQVLVYVATRDRSWEGEVYTSLGEATLPLQGLPPDRELVILVPYLHRSATFTIKEGAIESEIRLDLPAYPVYLP